MSEYQSLLTRPEGMSRQVYRKLVRAELDHVDQEDSGHTKAKVGIGKRMKWLSRHPKVAGMYTIAVNILRNSDRASMPTWRAIKKMMVILAQQPRVNVTGLGRVPFMLTQGIWERGTWRSYPHAVIDANMKVAE